MLRIKMSCFLFTLMIFTVDAEETIRTYADRIGLNIGIAIRESYITNSGGSSTIHNEIVKNEFNTLVCENAMKSQNLTRSKGYYDFSTADKVVDFAIANDMKVRGHTLIWYFQNSSWLQQGPRDTLLANMKFHIEKVVDHYKGKVFQWDVVNEPFAAEGTGAYRTQNNPWQTVIGEDYIDSAFVWAHAADPDCKLYLNEFSTTFFCAKSDSLLSKVKRMLANGIPIHGVGFQCHESAFKFEDLPIIYDNMKRNFERFTELGLDIAITELDIESSDRALQGANYRMYLRAAFEIPRFKTLLVWGVSDRDSWRSSGTPLLYDGNFEPKPCHDSLLAFLENPVSVDIAFPVRFRSEPYVIGIGPWTTPSSTYRQHDGRVELFDLRGARAASIQSSHIATAHFPPELLRASGTRLVRGGGQPTRTTTRVK